jgi:DNA-binding MarR family transcriptional regulator
VTVGAVGPSGPSGPPAGPSEVEVLTTRVVSGVLRAESALSAALGPVIRAHGVSIAGFNVLMILDGADGPLCPHEVSDRRLVTRGTLTGVLDSLERDGLIERAPNPTDRRSVLLSLTGVGTTRLRRMLPDVRRREAELLAGLTADERRTLAGLVERLAPPLHLDGCGTPTGAERTDATRARTSGSPSEPRGPDGTR